MFLLSFWPDSASPWLSGLLPGLQIHLKRTKNIGFGKHAQQNARKNSGLGVGKSPGPYFFRILFSLRRISIVLSGFICLPQGLPGTPPAEPESCSFHTKIIFARKDFRKPDQIIVREPLPFKSNDNIVLQRSWATKVTTVSRFRAHGLQK